MRRQGSIFLVLMLGVLSRLSAQTMNEIFERVRTREQEAFQKAYYWKATVYSKDTQSYPHELKETVDLKVEPLSEGVLLFRGQYPAWNLEEGGYDVLEFHTLYHSEWYGCITYDASGKVPYSFTVMRTKYHALHQAVPFCSAWVTPLNAPFLVGANAEWLLRSNTDTTIPVEVKREDDEHVTLSSFDLSLSQKIKIKYNIRKRSISKLIVYEGLEIIPQDMLTREVSDEEVLQRLKSGQLRLMLARSHLVLNWRKVGNLWLPNEFVEDCPGCIGDKYQITWRLQSVRDVKSPRDWRTEIPKGIVVMDYRHCGPVAGAIPEGCRPAIYEWQGDFEDRAPAKTASNRTVPWLSWILLATPILLIILGTLWLIKRWRQAHA